MQTFILVIHLILAIAMVAVILLQRSEGGGLGIGGGSGGGGGGFMTGRDTANLLTRTTAILAVGFIATSLTLAILASNSSKKGSILDSPKPAVQEAPKPTGPSAPLAN
ncbi:MAG: preprotein translocase subunit SecG [Rhodospirillaceae bacterium]|jgi:preprotein translocase subunit SecG|nr:preprotein translocase subunit SecG [Rhodospirillaceae bacterium]MBT7485966.1 preprotein translocase subunit SecG [Rhodospirillales bacterium]MBT4700221.1 preprotein translocase subunit SecG [Rhodospirillaceae bacterium]MBT5035028.1 preprotein translocase subunit SecG [Rhodospirillaceae bacterium]MBT6221805.1 preprotein translocase subunit SecG [Rhodospirillaceae bacterium]